ncbi:hypothetical protein [Mycolicibacterium phlei]
MRPNQSAADLRRNIHAGRLTVAVIVTIYTLVLAWVYDEIISPRFGYGGFVTIDPDFLSVLRDAMTCGLLALLLPTSVTRPSDLGRILVLFLVTIPTVTVPTFLTDYWDTGVTEAKFYGIAAYLILTATLAVLPRAAIPPLRLPGNTSLYGLLALSAVAIVVLGLSYGFTLKFHALTDVYDQREIYSEGGGGRGIIGITAGLLQNALAPLFLALGLYRRSLFYFLVGFFILFYIYSITGLKSSFIGFIFVLVTYALTALTTRFTFTRVWCISLTVFVGASALFSSVPGLAVGVDLMVRRVLAMQGMLTYNYIRIFGNEEPTYYSHTIFRVFFQDPFTGNPPDIVGSALLGRSVHANASFMTDGYVSGKVVGVVFATVVVAVFLVLLDSISGELPTAVALSSTCLVIFIATQSGVVTALINHGGLALAACIWLAGSNFSDSKHGPPPPLDAPARRSRA